MLCNHRAEATEIHGFLEFVFSEIHYWMPLRSHINKRFMNTGNLGHIHLRKKAARKCLMSRFDVEDTWNKDLFLTHL